MSSIATRCIAGATICGLAVRSETVPVERMPEWPPAIAKPSGRKGTTGGGGGGHSATTGGGGCGSAGGARTAGGSIPKADGVCCCCARAPALPVRDALHDAFALKRPSAPPGPPRAGRYPDTAGGGKGGGGGGGAGGGTRGCVGSCRSITSPASARPATACERSRGVGIAGAAGRERRSSVDMTADDVLARRRRSDSASARSHDASAVSRSIDIGGGAEPAGSPTGYSYRT